MEISERVDDLDEALFDNVTAQITTFDRWALLALHSAVAERLGTFRYLEIGSYLGGSLQALLRDPRCAEVISVDPRVPVAPDARGYVAYDENTTQNMVSSLSRVPGIDLTKLQTFEQTTDCHWLADATGLADYCFIDGEHTNEAALRDARFCRKVLRLPGIIAFHDSRLVAAAIRTFLRETWDDISAALAFADGVFAVEFGDAEILRAPVVHRAVASRWHSAVWGVANSLHMSPLPVLMAWSAIPPIDHMVARWKNYR